MTGTTDIVKQDKLIAYADDIISHVVDAPTAEGAMDDIEFAKVLIERANAAGEVACVLLVKEAELLRKVASMSCWEQVDKRRDMLKWVHGKSDEAWEKIVERCSQGTSISRIKAEETRAENEVRKLDRHLEEHKRISGEIRKEFEETGKTRLSVEEYDRRWTLKEMPDIEARRAFIEKTKNDLINAGAVGLGDGTGRYTNPLTADRDETKAFVENRLRSLANDVHALKQECVKARYVVPAAATQPIRDALDLLEVAE